jgi:hypothetical protein
LARERREYLGGITYRRSTLIEKALEPAMN